MKVIVDTGILFRGQRLLLEIELHGESSVTDWIEQNKLYLKEFLQRVTS